MSSLPTNRIGRRALAGAVSAAVAGTAAPVVLAQQGIEEVIVSARKRDENIQDIPQAVLSFSAADGVEKGRELFASCTDVAFRAAGAATHQVRCQQFQRPDLAHRFAELKRGRRQAFTSDLRKH